MSCTNASQCPDGTLSWFATAYTGPAGLAGDEVKVFTKNWAYIGICQRTVFDTWNQQVPYNILSAESMASWRGGTEGDGTNRRAYYALGDPSSFLFNNQNFTNSNPANTYYYTKGCRDINQVALNSISSPSGGGVYMKWPGTSEQRYIHDILYRVNAHIWGWDLNGWIWQKWVLKPADHQPRTVLLAPTCNGSTGGSPGQYYCPTSPTQCASPAKIGQYVNSVSQFGWNSMLAAGSFTAYRDGFKYGWWSSGSWKVFRGLNAGGTALASANTSTARNMNNIGANVLVMRWGVNGLPTCTYVIPKPIGLIW